MDEICIIGEATIRPETGLIDELEGKIELIRSKKLDLLKLKNIIK